MRHAGESNYYYQLDRFVKDLQTLNGCKDSKSRSKARNAVPDTACAISFLVGSAHVTALLQQCNLPRPITAACRSGQAWTTTIVIV
jgi:hypothetical protein